MTKYLATCYRSSLPTLIGIRNEKRIKLRNYSEAGRGCGEIIERNEFIPNMSFPKGETESSSYVPFESPWSQGTTICRGQVKHPSGYKHSEPSSTASNYRVKPKCRGKISPGFDPNVKQREELLSFEPWKRNCEDVIVATLEDLPERGKGEEGEGEGEEQGGGEEGEDDSRVASASPSRNDCFLENTIDLLFATHMYHRNEEPVSIGAAISTKAFAFL
ncbi:hypothetical protein V1478_017259 [Vespula squamosa]|uniref:Uncharacterized protein n=1 Tax=Vespula squamosa TaxID=30214 RepID=A0ABD1ZXH1_VESSQ